MGLDVASDGTDQPESNGNDREGGEAMEPAEVPVTDNPEAAEAHVVHGRDPEIAHGSVDAVATPAEDLDRADGEDKKRCDDVAGKQHIPRLHPSRIGALSSKVHQDSLRPCCYPRGTPPVSEGAGSAAEGAERTRGCVPCEHQVLPARRAAAGGPVCPCDTGGVLASARHPAGTYP